MMEAIRSSETSVLTRAMRCDIPEHGIRHSHRGEKPQILHSINRLGSVAETNVFPVRYKLGFHIPEDNILHSRRRETLKPYTPEIAHTEKRNMHSNKRKSVSLGYRQLE
jgi:hypothetical protein